MPVIGLTAHAMSGDRDDGRLAIVGGPYPPVQGGDRLDDPPALTAREPCQDAVVDRDLPEGAIAHDVDRPAFGIPERRERDG